MTEQMGDVTDDVAAAGSQGEKEEPQEVPPPADIDLDTGACTYNQPCAQQYVGKSQSCMVISGRLIPHAS